LKAGSLNPHIVENYFNYFTEIEEHFQRRRGTLLLLSPLDWALMETWKDAGISLEAVLRGIDVTFEKWERRPRKTRKVNGLAFCAQEVLASAEELKEAAVGAPAHDKGKRDAGLDQSAVAEYLKRNASQLDQLQLPGSAQALAQQTAATLLGLAESLAQGKRCKWKTWSGGSRLPKRSSSPRCWPPRLTKRCIRCALKLTATWRRIVAR
jgi:hypothetical protein